MLSPYPAWRKAYDWETPEQLEPQLTETFEPKVHVIDLNTNQSFCNKAVFGDRAITVEQAQDPDNGLYFDCEECYVAIMGEKPV